MGQYVRDNLGAGEQVVFETKNHWIVFVSLRSILTLFISPIIALATNEYAITNKRVIIKEGLLTRRSLDMNISKIESVAVEQSLFGRLLGYGSMIVRGTGGTNEPFDRIADPMKFRKIFQELSNR